jgi:pyruvate dehydrogenase E2 component (dihydrolipoamide acetyltransferase)
MAEITMPSLSDAMEEGTILQWLVADGEAVRAGHDLVEIEIDKATVVYPAEVAGVLRHVAQAGDTLPVGTPIAFILAAGDTLPVPDGSTPAEASAGASHSHALAAAVPGGASDVGPALRASPLARRVARGQGLDLSSLTGSGTRGRIIRADVEAALTLRRSNGSTGAAAPVKGAVNRGTPERVDLSRVQRAAANRMVQAKSTIPEFTVTVEIDMGLAVEMRAQLKLLDTRPLPTYNDLIVKASAIALREFPRVNASFQDGVLELYPRVNIGVAVAAASELFVPVVLDADQCSVGQLAAMTRALSEKVRIGSITHTEMQAATFTVSNLGMFGASHFTAIINPPQAAILAVGALTERVVSRDGQLVSRPFMFATMACDHRVLNGAEAASFTARVKQLLEQPLALLT